MFAGSDDLGNIRAWQDYTCFFDSQVQRFWVRTAIKLIEAACAWGLKFKKTKCKCGKSF